jgi:TetR/AcrR family transcriptional regulator, transcriptional repressor for nem operon
MLVKPEGRVGYAWPERQMRGSGQRKADTRQRILDAASALFRRYGIDGIGVDAIMHEAGLTHGGFYSHFASKEALAAEVAAVELARSAAKWDEISHGPDPAVAFARIVEPYLDPAHVAAVSGGCALPALGPELARRPHARAGLARPICTMLTALQRCRPEDGAVGAMARLSCMVGAVLLARLSQDPALAAGLLDAAKKSINAA